FDMGLLPSKSVVPKRFESGNSLAPGMNDTLAVGKSFIFAKKPETNWSKIHQLASGVRFSSGEDVAGLKSLRLPLIGSQKAPAVVVLDSCFGSLEILANAFEGADESRASVVFSE